MSVFLIASTKTKRNRKMSLSKEVKDLLQDPEAIWQAMSIDGVSYPFDATLHGRNAEERAKIAKMVKIYDDGTAISIGNMILKRQEKVESPRLFRESGRIDAVLGAMVRRQIIKHLEKIAESK
jgi:hypothetical protein